MTKPELARRMSEVAHADFLRALRMVRDGYGAHGIQLESPLTLKQANAAFEWVNRYGNINPRPGECKLEVAASDEVFAVKTPLGEFVLVKKGVVGYWPTTPDLAARLIEQQGPAVTRSALEASMFGWDIPAAIVAKAATGLQVAS